MAENWMTQEAYDRLTAELEERSGPTRSEITRKIDAARREGDLKENGGYHAAREEQSLNETRIQQLQAILKDAVVGEAKDDGTVQPGMLVTVQMGSREKQFLLGSRDAAEGLEVEVYSPEAPLGAAILGHSAGETVSYTAPTGKEISIKILEARPYTA